ncbi:glycosyltransferase involved in cell wall biosynthesis [Pedobacter sp. CG_S7]|uniref:glycosyltransferase family 2 protein n=1 Tax=Pedobacter sp. CG_S7 TaxID=3143930 RepID=UPI003394EA12
MKVSIITVVLNCANYISDCIDSILIQTHKNIEYIVIDGKSVDGTIAVIEKYLPSIDYFISVPDEGIYSALNKGLSVATGEIIGILNADDVLANAHVISTIVENFKNSTCDAVYGNLNYTSRNDINQVIRRWRSKSFRRNAVKYGWMPPHPTIYIKKEVFFKHGNYSMEYGHSSDYELILRFFYKHQIVAVFVDQLFVKMRMGGVSNGSVKQLLRACSEDYRAMILNDIPIPLVAIVGKKLRKIEQFL